MHLTTHRPTLLLGANSVMGWSILRYGMLPNVVPVGSTPKSVIPNWISFGVDIRSEESIKRIIKSVKPALIIHAAGMCKVEKCEAFPDFAYDMNVLSTKHILKYIEEETRLIYMSSDHVFGGNHGPYFEHTKRQPISVYGNTRCQAEDLVLKRKNSLVIRSGLWIGPSSTGRMGHLDWLKYRHFKKLPMTIVNDEFRSALWSSDAALAVRKLSFSQTEGIRHVNSKTIVDRPRLANHLSDLMGLKINFNVHPGKEQPAPHLGRVDFKSAFQNGETDLIGVMESLPPSDMEIGFWQHFPQATKQAQLIGSNI